MVYCKVTDKKRIRNIMRGHLLFVKDKPIKLKKVGDEFFKTRYWNVILGKNYISFKKNNKVHRFNFVDIKKFFLKDNYVFVIDIAKPKKRFYFKIVE